MKKRPKKLELHRETIRTLHTNGLVRIAGVGDTYEIATGCDCTDGCETSGIACPTFTCFTQCNYTCAYTCQNTCPCC